MSSRARNFRRRGDDDNNNNDDNQNNNTHPTTKPSSSSSSLKPKKPQNQTPKNLLSFADDEDEDIQQQQQQTKTKTKTLKSNKTSRLSKASSSSTHKITSTKDRQNPSSSSSLSTLSNVQPQAGTYTKEALLELQKNTRILAKPAEPNVVIKGSLKPQQPLEEEDRDHNDAETRLAEMGIGGFPDQAMIDAIRAKRERMRQSRTSAVAAAPDYISLDGGAGEGLSDEEPEFRERVAMFGTSTAKKKGVFEEDQEENLDNGLRKNTSVAHVVEYGGVDNEEDEEEKIWEEEQFRKGLGKRMDDGSNTSRVVTSSNTASMNVQQQQQQQPQKYMYPGPPPPQPVSVYGSMPTVSTAPTSIGGAFGASQGLDVMSISQQADVAKKAMQDNFMRLKESHGKTISSLTKTDENLSNSLLNITALEKSLSAASEKFVFMQELRGFISVICEFLQHKAPFIEEVEEQMQTLHEERASAILERRASDNDDEMFEVEAAVKAAMSVFSERGSSTAMIAVATSTAQAASAAIREQANLVVKLDEFGRDMNLQKRMDMTRRADARQHRKARFDSKRLSSMEVDDSYQQIEGESSTDESDSESTAYQSNRDLLLQTADQIFSDASEDYSQLSMVKERFERWKRDYSSSYRDAYMSLSAPAIFSPYVRLELLKWDPLHEEADFFDMKWHLLLFNYGLPEDRSDLSPDDADANLIPGLVERVALPILHHEIAHCWDMFSTRETKNAVSATNLVTNYVDPSSEGLAELLVAIRTRLSDAVANIMVPTWSPLVLKAVPNAPRVAAYRFGMSVRLMRNICLWKEILALPVLEKLALDELLCGKVLPHVRSIASNVHDAVTRTERIVASLSGVWSGPSITGKHSRKLQPLVDYIMSLGKIIEKKHGVDEGETGGLARRLKKMLVELNEYDNARDITRTFRLKEAL